MMKMMQSWLAGKPHEIKDKTGRWSYYAPENRCYNYSGAHRDTGGDCAGKGNRFETKFLCEKVCKLRGIKI